MRATLNGRGITSVEKMGLWNKIRIAAVAVGGVIVSLIADLIDEEKAGSEAISPSLVDIRTICRAGSV